MDVSMAPVRSREWEINEVALAESGRSRFIRKAPSNPTIVDWREVPSLVLASRQSTERTIAEMHEMKPADMAREVASIRMQMGELATRDYLRSELRDELRSLLEEIEASPVSH